MRLDPDSLEVNSFETSEKTDAGGTIFCCTGCVSGCGINPTAGGCESQAKTYEFVTCGNNDTIAFEAHAAE
jgi:hypothetical protein